MHLEVIGSSPAWPNPGEAHAGYLLTSGGGKRLLLECGPGVLSRLRKRDLLPVDAIAITHLHLDHWGDLVPWCWLKNRDPGSGGKRPQLWLPPGGVDALTKYAGLFGSDQMFERTFDMSEYSPRTPFPAADCMLEAIPVAHFGAASFGFRVSGDATVGYSGDSAPCEGLAELARGADIFLCEATLAHASDDGVPRGHLTAEEACEAAGSTPVLLVHRPTELGAAGSTSIAAPGMQIDLQS